MIKFVYINILSTNLVHYQRPCQFQVFHYERPRQFQDMNTCPVEEEVGMGDSLILRNDVSKSGCQETSWPVINQAIWQMLLSNW